LEKKKIFNEYQKNDNNVERIHADAKLIVTHIAKYDNEKIRVFLEDIKLFFNIHNHPEIKIIGKNISSNQNEIRNNSLKKENKRGNFKSDEKSNYDNEYTNYLNKFNIFKSKKSEKDLSQTIDSNYINNRKNDLKYNVFHNSFYDKAKSDNISYIKTCNRQNNKKQLKDERNEKDKETITRFKSTSRSSNFVNNSNAFRSDNYCERYLNIDNNNYIGLCKKIEEKENPYPKNVKEFSIDEYVLKDKDNSNINTSTRINSKNNTSYQSYRRLKQNNVELVTYQDNKIKGNVDNSLTRNDYDYFSKNEINDKFRLNDKDNSIKGLSCEVYKNLKSKYRTKFL